MSVEVERPGSEADRLIGEVLANRYQIEERLGEGAMGTVFKARHVKVGRAFAVKVLHPRLLEDPKTLQRFEREAELAGRLRHPNVIGVVDVGETGDGLHYMVMDFAAGPDLATLLGEAPMPPQRIIQLVGQLLEGLFHAHEHGLIHRDFKPENVIVERDSHGAEVARIVDFGIAILRDGGESGSGPGRLTTNGLVLGTPHYMAPEQAVADPIDHRIDLFALGIVIYEMLCGKLPFDGTGAEVARANLLLDPPAIATRVPYLEVDPLLEAFARRLMTKQRDRRPATAKVARELLDLIARDREAAAAALGVAKDVAVRPPMTTQPVSPQRATDHPGTFPPPIRELQATPPQAPAMKAPLVASAMEHQFSTEIAAPRLARRRRRVVLVGMAVAGIAAIGITILAKFGGTKPDPTDTRIATTTPSIAKPAEPIARPAEPIAVPAQPIAVPVEPTPVPPVGKARHTVTTKPVARATTPVVPPATPAPEVAKPADPIATPTQTRPVEVVRSVAPRTIDVRSLAMQYQSVGAELKALEQAKGADAASDLQSRYRLMRITDAMSTQPKRDEAAAILSKLHAEIADRKSR